MLELNKDRDFAMSPDMIKLLNFCCRNAFRIECMDEGYANAPDPMFAFYCTKLILTVRLSDLQFPEQVLAKLKDKLIKIGLISKNS